MGWRKAKQFSAAARVNTAVPRGAKLIRAL